MCTSIQPPPLASGQGQATDENVGKVQKRGELTLRPHTLSVHVRKKSAKEKNRGGLHRRTGSLMGTCGQNVTCLPSFLSASLWPTLELSDWRERPRGSDSSTESSAHRTGCQGCVLGHLHPGHVKCYMGLCVSKG